jgi:hypothetical protein
MRSDRLSWDDDWAAGNPIKHDGVTFDEATKVFDDPTKVEWLDARHCRKGEGSFKIIGHSGNHLLVVINSERGARKHILSAWKADKHDREAYLRQRP